MSEQLFDVVFFGIIQTGRDKEVVMQNMATLFKTDVSKLAPYFAGGRKVIKGKVDAETAEKYRAALDNVGLVIKLEACESEDDSGEDDAPAENKSKPSQDQQRTDTTAKDIPGDETPPSGITMAPVGADVLENPTEVVAQKIDDISAISMAETGADIIENPVPVEPQQIGDISSLTMAEVGSDVLENPTRVSPQQIDDISGISMAEVGADIIADPEPEKTVEAPDTSGLSLDEEKPG